MVFGLLNIRKRGSIIGKHNLITILMCVTFCIVCYLHLDAKVNFVGSELANSKHKIVMVKEAESFIAECTAYTAGYESTGKTPDHPAYGITASGRKVSEGMIAADTSVLPFGTKVWIEGLGVFVVEDTGGDIKGNRIDIYMNDLDEAVKFGRQERRVIVLE